MPTYTQEYIEFARKYPYEVHEDFLNGVKNDVLFTNKADALNYMERGRLRTPRARFTLVPRELIADYMPVVTP